MRAHPDTPLSIEVTISTELLQLVGRAHGAVDDKPGEWDRAPAGEQGDPVGWRCIVLRQDGQRPLSIRGMKLFECARPATSPSGSFEQRFVLYVADDSSIYASLGFDPDEIVGACPAYLSRHIADADALVALVRDWWPEGCFYPGTTAGVSKNRDHAGGARLARSSFNAMMTECLRTGLLQA